MKLSRKIRNDRVSPARKRQWNRTWRYGLTSAQVEAMLRSQEGKCAICQEPLPSRYHIDHCLATGKVRGILCHGCNLKLPMVEDKARLAGALAYLDRSR
jgi:hypothetical protein